MYYAVEAKDYAGYTRFWQDYHTTAKEACKAAKDILREHPFWDIKVLKENRDNTAGIGTSWELFRVIRK